MAATTGFQDELAADIRRFLDGGAVTNERARHCAQMIDHYASDPAMVALAYMAYALVRLREGNDSASLFADTAVGYARQVSAPELLIRALCLRADCLIVTGQLAEAFRDLERAVAAAGYCRSARDLVVALARVSVSTARGDLAQNQYDRAGEHLMYPVAMLQVVQDASLRRMALAMQAVCQAMNGRHDLAEATLVQYRALTGEGSAAHPRLPDTEIAQLVDRQLPPDDAAALVARLVRTF